MLSNMTLLLLDKTQQQHDVCRQVACAVSPDNSSIPWSECCVSPVMSSGLLHNAGSKQAVGAIYTLCNTFYTPVRSKRQDFLKNFEDTTGLHHILRNNRLASLWCIYICTMYVCV